MKLRSHRHEEQTQQQGRTRMAIAFCLDCGHPVSLEPQPVEGQRMTCSNCGAQLELLSLDPLELDWAYLAPIVDDEDWKKQEAVS